MARAKEDVVWVQASRRTSGESRININEKGIVRLSAMLGRQIRETFSDCALFVRLGYRKDGGRKDILVQVSPQSEDGMAKLTNTNGNTFTCSSSALANLLNISGTVSVPASFDPSTRLITATISDEA